MIADAPPAIVQIAQRAASQERGIVLYRLHRVFDVHAGPSRRHDDFVMAIVAQDARIVKVRVLHAESGGKELDENAKAQLERQYEQPKPSDVFHRPFDPAYLNEYSYQELDPRTYRFTSALRDGSHGNGTLSLDADGNVVRYQYTPNVLPQYAKSGSVANERSQVLPGVWYLIREAHEYRGRYFIFSGGATAVITCDSFESYRDLPSALAALAGNRFTGR